MTKRQYLNTLDGFTLAYLGCALWSSTDNATPSGGEPLDANYNETDITWKSLRSMVADCKAFQADNAALLSLAGGLRAKRA
jgi:hypothetical protein